jgi:hypothetical protein
MWQFRDGAIGIELKRDNIYSSAFIVSAGKILVKVE